VTISRFDNKIQCSLKVWKNINVQWNETEGDQLSPAAEWISTWWPASPIPCQVCSCLTNSLQGMLMPHQFPTRYAHALPIPYKVCSWLTNSFKGWACLTNSLQGLFVPHQFPTRYAHAYTVKKPSRFWGCHRIFPDLWAEYNLAYPGTFYPVYMRCFLTCIERKSVPDHWAELFPILKHVTAPILHSPEKSSEISHQ
jgi:hypothetical protein